MYHWDGPGAIQHLDALLSVPKLNMIQWTPGAGAEPTWHERWWPLYHRIFDAGKSVLLGADNVEQLLALKREFGEQCKQMLIGTWAPTVEEAEAQIKAMEF
jgi:hypothetical protein